MKKFYFTDESQRFIKHGIRPEFTIEVLTETSEDWVPPSRVFSWFEFKGRHFLLIMSESIVPESEISDLEPYKRALEKAWKWYRSQVYIK